ncbi:hypothetical protein BDQ12DRAFT_683230 [Crucibulum laeve]|uniref:Uncharacterized protein n=1 Tax=Crucibulum laeve TaxID=68775 RepID=A0A5C3M1X0_9AGAR|nr:hypothetical protein BDQ12DRAFT_683230 [Crucibulum laeve]
MPPYLSMSLLSMPVAILCCLNYVTKPICRRSLCRHPLCRRPLCCCHYTVAVLFLVFLCL